MCDWDLTSGITPESQGISIRDTRALPQVVEEGGNPRDVWVARRQLFRLHKYTGGSYHRRVWTTVSRREYRRGGGGVNQFVSRLNWYPRHPPHGPRIIMVVIGGWIGTVLLVMTYGLSIPIPRWGMYLDQLRPTNMYDATESGEVYFYKDKSG